MLCAARCVVSACGCRLSVGGSLRKSQSRGAAHLVELRQSALGVPPISGWLLIMSFEFALNFAPKHSAHSSRLEIGLDRRVYFVNCFTDILLLILL